MPSLYVPSLYGPSLLWAEFVMCRVDPTPFKFENSEWNSTLANCVSLENVSLNFCEKPSVKHMFRLQTSPTVTQRTIFRTKLKLIFAS